MLHGPTMLAPALPTRLRRALPRLAAGALVASSCTASLGPPAGSPGGGSKDDSAYVSDSAYELGGVFRGVLTRPADTWYAELATDRDLQRDAIDQQLRFARRALKHEGYILNQLVHELRALDVSTQDDLVTLRYEVTVDLVRNAGGTASVPALDELPDREFDVSVPLDPIALADRLGDGCATPDADGTLENYNYYYYFDPAKAGCQLELATAHLTITEVYPRPVVYPEYDLLAHPLLDVPGVGFTAALIPTRGDDDELALFHNVRGMLEDGLGLVAEPAGDDGRLRYLWPYATGGEGGHIVLDLWDPTKAVPEDLFRDAAQRYDLLYFAGHSIYGSRDLYTATSFKPGYQIVLMWSCYSYAYYSRQLFRSKATADDPEGWAGADFVGTSPTPYFGDEHLGLGELLRGLWRGLNAIERGEPGAAPDWVRITNAMNATSVDRPYGAAGVRENRWRP